LIDPRSEEVCFCWTDMRDMHRKYGDRGVLPVAVCIANDEGAARVVAMGEGVNYPVLVDWGSHPCPRAADASPLAGAFRVNDMPYVAVTDRRRRIRAIIEGISTYDGQLLENAVRRQARRGARVMRLLRYNLPRADVPQLVAAGHRISSFNSTRES